MFAQLLRILRSEFFIADALSGKTPNIHLMIQIKNVRMIRNSIYFLFKISLAVSLTLIIIDKGKKKDCPILYIAHYHFQVGIILNCKYILEPMEEGNQTVKDCIKKMIKDNDSLSLCGKSLKTLFEDKNGQFSLKSVLMMMDQMIARIQQRHQYWIHGRISPASFCITSGNHTGHIKLKGFGLKSNICDKFEHTPVNIKKKIDQSLYHSIKVKLGIEPSFRDDMESIGYVALQFLTGSLPKQQDPCCRFCVYFKNYNHCKYSSYCKSYCRQYKKKYKKMSLKKKWKEIPQEFTIYLNQCKKLKMNEKPPYSEMRKLFRDLLSAKGFTFDYKYDWITQQQQQIFPKYLTSSYVRNKLGNQIVKNLIINKAISIQNDGKVIFEGIQTTINVKVAIKVEPIFLKHPEIFNEVKLYNSLLDDCKSVIQGIPNIYHHATKAQYNILVMDRLGLSLEKLLLFNIYPFSLKTVLMLIDQIITIVEYIHNHGIVFGNIKPGNFCIGFGKLAHKLYIIDFGTGRSYVQIDGSHVSQKNSFIWGNRDYYSLNSHDGIGQSRRDDMESIGYMIMHFLRGSLPWLIYNRSAQIKIIKKNTSIKQLCGKYPQQFAQYLTQCRNLKFDEKPPYASMRKMFKDLFLKKGYTFDYQYDWVIKDEKRRKRREEETKSKDKLNIILNTTQQTEGEQV